jgi:two-component system response regulator HydG
MPWLEAVEVETEPGETRGVEEPLSGREVGGRATETDRICFDVGKPLEDLERAAIVRTLESVDGNRRRAAEILGIGERTLYRKLKQYDL